jgi:hypothetical protein
MACRSCGIGPIRSKKNYSKPKVEVVAKPHPSKGVISTNTKKVSVPTRSPARTFNTVGES